jgi:hypothetical protein
MTLTPSNKNFATNKTYRIHLKRFNKGENMGFGHVEVNKYIQCVRCKITPKAAAKPSYQFVSSK